MLRLYNSSTLLKLNLTALFTEAIIHYLFINGIKLGSEFVAFIPSAENSLFNLSDIFVSFS